MIAVIRRLSAASPSPGVLVALFLVSFSLPFFGTLLVRGVYNYVRADNVGPAAVNYGPLGDPAQFSSASLVRVANDPTLDPAADGDFLVYVWFSLKDLPAIDHNIVLLEKREKGDPNEPGYALGIRHDTDAFRAIAYWRDRSGRGRWFTFSDMEVLPRTWMMLALSYRGGRYIGVHGAIRLSEREVHSKLLGGYDLQQSVLPHSRAPLRAGSLNDRKLRTKIGPVAVVSGKNLAEEFRNILKEATKRPASPPSSVRSSSLPLWTFSGEDRSGIAGRKISVVDGKDIAQD